MMTFSVIFLLIISLGSPVLAGHAFLLYSPRDSRNTDPGPYISNNNDNNQGGSLQSPCPSIFNYQNDENGNLVGSVRVDQSNIGGKIQLNIELSVGNIVHGYNGMIVLAEDRQKVINDIMRGGPVFYKVLFPAWQNIPPKITKISVNGNLICSGPGIPIQMVQVLTVINLQHKLSLDVTPLISASDPTVDSSPGFNNVAPSSSDSPGQDFNFDVRKDDNNNNYPSTSNNIFYSDNNRGIRQDSSPNPFFDVKNPYNFRPAGTPPPRPIVPQINGNRGQINPNNPFLTGLSTPQPSRTGEEIAENPFFIPRNEQTPATIRPTTESSGIIREPSRIAATSNIKDICGRPVATNQLIVDGQSIPRGAYPWLVAIFRQLDNLGLSYICSGSLVSEKHVVTAAHCVKLEYRRVKPNEIVCVFGKLNIRKWVVSPGEAMLEPETITVHPDYQPGRADADIAILTFPDPIPFSKTVMPLCLWQGSTDLNQVVGQLGTVVGWGRNEHGDLSSAEPRQVRMPIVDQLDCLKSSSSSVGQALLEIISKNTFCAGFRNGSGPCNGDSGSAFLLSVNGVFYLRGIVSTALSEVTHKSCNLQEYVVFTDATKYLDWIAKIIKTT